MFISVAFDIKYEPTLNKKFKSGKTEKVLAISRIFFEKIKMLNIQTAILYIFLMTSGTILSLKNVSVSNKGGFFFFKNHKKYPKRELFLKWMQDMQLICS